MKTNRIAIWTALAATLITSAAGVANASTLELVTPNNSRGEYLTMSYNGSDISGFAGALSFSIDGSSTLVDMFCVDITTFAYLNSPYQAVALPTNAISNGDRAAWLFLNYDATATDMITGAALQLALWDVVHDGGDGLNMGLFRSTVSIPNAVVTLASSLIDASAGQSADGAVIWQSVLGKEDRQGMIGAVPEPSSMILLGSGLALAAWRARRTRS